MNTNPIRLCLVLHNHQPVGNFDGVFEQAYQDSYLPFLDVFEDYEDLRISLHTSGPLIEWLDKNHPEYLDRLAGLATAGRVEIIGGAFYEPILTMIPSRDRVGQIVSYTEWLEDRLGGKVRGMWIAERVWEQSLASDIRRANIEYTLLDDAHFRNAGLAEDPLHGYYLTEDDGEVLKIFPGSEHLRYLIPFRDPSDTIHHLRELANHHPNTVAVFGDDGEKFGTWPDTNKHCYQDGWLRRFFDALRNNGDWLKTATLAEAIDHVPAAGRIFLPDGSYREMSEWALPVSRQLEHADLIHDLEHDPNWPRIKPFMRAGYWRNFKAKYPEANEMYARMMMVSREVEEAEKRGVECDDLRFARRELYRAQCNCSYWHGAFGGVYLPHLRDAVYNHLIAAENLVDRAHNREAPRFEATAGDYNFDAQMEACLVNEKLVALIAPVNGGMLYELDVRSICHNLLATLTRRPESYHRKVLNGASGGGEDCASIHDRVVFKQAGLDSCLRYDNYPRKSLIDHFYDNDATLDAVASGESWERGDFSLGAYDAVIRKSADRHQVKMTRDGNAWGIPLRITKGVTVERNGMSLEIAYLIEGIPADAELHFASEFNFAGMPAGADDRYFYDSQGNQLGHLGTKLDLHDVAEIGLVDRWLGLDVRLDSDRPTRLWTYPVESVSQSEGGFELVHQSIAVIPHWTIRGDADGRWSVQLRLTADTSMAEHRQKATEPALV